MFFDITRSQSGFAGDSDHSTPHKSTSNINDLLPHGHKRQDKINALKDRAESPNFLQHPAISTFPNLGRTIHNTLGNYTTCLTDGFFFAHKLMDQCGLRRKDARVEDGISGEVIHWKEQPQIVIHTHLGKKTNMIDEEDEKQFLERLLTGMCLAFLRIYECKGKCCSEVPEDEVELEYLFTRLSKVIKENLRIKLDLR